MLPDTPCVWLSHWKKCKAPIKKMILFRHAAGITNQSVISKSEESTVVYDLQGRRVEKPAVRGIYIVNGRKVER
ncbi:MAG: hypothetical protein ILA29_08005 [Prevotella sp.]|nr:hypothetical protein [Prevotella sp.]